VDRLGTPPLTKAARFRRYQAAVPPGYRFTAHSLAVLFDLTEAVACPYLCRGVREGTLVRESIGVYRTTGRPAVRPARRRRSPTSSPLES
jgi:hypothetical protein